MSFKNISIKELEESKVYVSVKSDAFSFKHPLDYASSFIDLTSSIGGDLNIRVETDAVNANTDGSQNIAYSTVLFRHKLPERFNLDVPTNDMFGKGFSEIGFVLNFGSINPEIRCYTGSRISICDNGCIFGADDITSIKLVSSHVPIQKALELYVSEREVTLERYKRVIQGMSSTIYTEEGNTINQFIGKITRACIGNPKIGIGIATGMIKNISDSKTNYAIRDGKISEWVLYNACTEEVKKSSIKDEALKVQLVSDLFNINQYLN